MIIYDGCLGAYQCSRAQNESKLDILVPMSQLKTQPDKSKKKITIEITHLSVYCLYSD